MEILGLLAIAAGCGIIATAVVMRAYPSGEPIPAYVMTWYG